RDSARRERRRAGVRRWRRARRGKSDRWPDPDRRHAHRRGRRPSAARSAPPRRGRTGRAGRRHQQTDRRAGRNSRYHHPRVRDGKQPGAPRRRGPRPLGRRGPGERRGADRSWIDQGKAAGGAAPLPPQAFRAPAVRAARRHGDLIVAGSIVSRRVREFVGVALFAAALIWLISLASYEPGDAVWFFSTGSHAAPANFAGRVGAFLAELSFQLFGYASYFVPAILVVLGWHYFWCRSVNAAGTKITGAALLFSCVSAFMSLVFGSLDVSGKSFRAGGYVGEWLAKELAEYLNRTGSIIVIVTLIFLAIILSTHFS